MLINSLVRLKRAVLIARYFFSAKKKWYLPKRSQILVYDSTGIEPLWPYIKNYHPEILNINGGKKEIYILLATLSLFKKGNILERYGYEFIKIVKPKVVISHIDNNINFWLISQKHPFVKTIVIQNGIRADDDPFVARLLVENVITTKLQVDYMFAFGKNIPLEYKKHVKAEFIPIGGLKNNAIPKGYDYEEGSIIFISQYMRKPSKRNCGSIRRSI